MTALATSTAAELAAAAAVALATSMAAGEPLTASEASRDAAALEPAAHALLAEFTGAHTGELVVVVDDELADALRESTLGPLQLSAALAPALQAVAAALGGVALGTVQQVDARLAANRALAHPDAAVLALHDANGTLRAGVAVGIELPPTSGFDAGDEHQAGPERLDLLRGVEMQATAELGRARMTVNDLLSLRNGAVIELDRVAGAPADLYVNGRLIARGEVVVVDENYGLRITQVVTDDVAR